MSFHKSLAGHIKDNHHRFHFFFVLIISSAIGLGLSLGLGLSTKAQSSGLIPSDRLIAWQGNVGVEGGIPNRTTICTTLNPGATVAQINSALNACPDGQVVFLSAGAYSLSGTIIMPSNKTLRGAGANQTILTFSSSLGQDVSFDGGYTDNSIGGVGVTSGYTKGSNQLTLSSATGLSAGSFVYISELNDPNIPVSPNSAEGDCSAFGACGMYPAIGTRLRFQLSKVIAVSGNTITISPSMFFDFSGARSPQVSIISHNMVQFAGLESLTVRNTTANNSKNIRMQGTANSWVKDVKTDTCGARCIEAWLDVYRNEIRDNYITNCVSRAGSDRCYGVHLWAGTGNLIENNIFSATANGVIVVSSSGNVIGYNYMSGVHRTDDTSWFWPDSWTHGGHSTFNLWEGNDENALEWDLYWGGNSHNMAFRNRFHGRDLSIPNSADTTIGSILTYPNNNFTTDIGNVLGEAGYHTMYEETVYSASSKPIYLTVSNINWSGGMSGAKAFSTMLRHRNFDYFTNTTKSCGTAGEPGCQGGDASTVLPSSMYLAGKPSWFGTVVWPAIGPDVSGLTQSIPAKVCFEQGLMPNCLLAGGSVPPPAPVPPPPAPQPPPPPPPAPPQAFINCNGSSGSCSVVSGSSLSISWTCLNSTSGVVSNNVNSTIWSILSDVQTVNNVTTPRRYTLNCTGPGGTNSQGVDVIISTSPPLPVIPPPPPSIQPPPPPPPVVQPPPVTQPPPVVQPPPAVVPPPVAPPPAGPAPQALFDDFDVQSVPRIFAGLACYFVQFSLIAVGIVMIYSGIAFVVSHSNPTGLANAKRAFLYAIIGALVIYGVYTIILSISFFVVGSTNLPWVPLTCS